MKPPEANVVWIVLGRTAQEITAVSLGSDAIELRREVFPVRDLTSWVATAESVDAPRWVWGDAAAWYAPLVAVGVRVGRCHDLRLCHAIVRNTARSSGDSVMPAASAWDGGQGVAPAPSPDALFDLDGDFDPDDGGGDRDSQRAGVPDGVDDALSEFSRQREAIEAAADPARMRLLVAAESAGALVAVEMRAAGLPWDAGTHRDLLVAALGERSSAGRPARLEQVADEVRVALGDPGVSLDSQPKLLRALHRVGIMVDSTSRSELARHDHPVIGPLIEYKRLARLMSANGWAWLAEWVHDGRFRPVYVPAGVVTGRWASSGGGALQIPRQLRGAVRADPGWSFVIADVAQLEPRVLAAMARDLRLAEAARESDLYAGIVDSGAVATRADAKVAVLGAMYGATAGESGRLVPRLRRTYPRAMALVDDAAHVGEQGGVVSTLLGRTSPPPSSQWREVQARAGAPDASVTDESRARRWAGDRGRFTRNFVVQGTAAEWALAWMADLRQRLAVLEPVADADAAPRSGPAFSHRPHLAFFLHDEIIVHTPDRLADAAAVAVRGSAAAAGRLLFGDFPIDFPLDLRIAQTAEK